jgi:ubiquinone/menaquinone biosynthesis C-methylase UbiE
MEANLGVPMLTTYIAKFLMRFWEVRPDPDSPQACLLHELFFHNRFVHGSQAEKNAIMLNASLAKYDEELDYPWDHYFGVDLRPMLHGRTVLDLGSSTGGRGAAWAERYGLKHLIGVDVNEIYVESARRFAASRGISAEYRLGQGEALPLKDESVDAVLSFDVLEHVQEPGRVLSECHRVLKHKGMAFIVFPSYYQPIEHHLGLVTRFPGIQCLFSGKTLLQAYCKIIEERGSDALWYQRRSRELEPWERCYTINGLTLSKFEKYLHRNGWKVLLHPRIPFGQIGRNASRKPWIKVLANLFYPLTFVPGLREVFLHRVIFILQKT